MTSLQLAFSGKIIKGDYCPPGDKSISHRAVMFGALGSGESRFTGFLASEDCLRTASAFEKMGVLIRRSGGDLHVQGLGMRGLKAPQEELYLGNSGTSMRLLLGILAGQRFEAVLSGDPSLSSRPMKRVTVPLKRMGAQIKGKDDANLAPLTIRGGRLKAIEFDNQLGSAQVKSALLFAGMYAEGTTRIHDPLFSRDHTERFLASAGARFRKAGDWLEIEETSELRPLNMAIPGDFSSAAFFIAAAAMLPGSELLCRSVSLNPTRTGLLEVLKRMGARIEVSLEQIEPEPMGTVLVRGGRLSGTRVSKPEIPALIDELPILMTVMALAEGESLVSGAEELRVKETDRIHSMATNLNALGALVHELPDGCIIRGVETLQGGKTVSYADHRTVMSMAMASLASRGPVEIDDTASTATSYPAFFDDFRRLVV